MTSETFHCRHQVLTQQTKNCYKDRKQFSCFLLRQNVSLCIERQDVQMFSSSLCKHLLAAASQESRSVWCILSLFGPRRGANPSFSRSTLQFSSISLAKTSNTLETSLGRGLTRDKTILSGGTDPTDLNFEESTRGLCGILNW